MPQVTSASRHATGSMVVFDPTARMVLLIHHRVSGVWQFPGGHVDMGEAPAEAALREVYEETGVRASLVDQPGITLPGMTAAGTPCLVMEIPAPAKPDRGPGKPAEPPHSHIDHLFLGIADSTAPVTAQETEVCGTRWVDIGDLGSLDVRAEVPQVVAWAWARLFEANDHGTEHVNTR